MHLVQAFLLSFTAFFAIMNPFANLPNLYDYDVFPLTIRGTIIHNDVVNTI